MIGSKTSSMTRSPVGVERSARFVGPAVRCGLLVLIAFLIASVRTPVVAQVAPAPLRGDSNGSGAADISDAIHVLNFLFGGGPAPVCPAVADVNASGEVDISDPIALLNALFSGGTVVPPLGEDEIASCAAPSVTRRGSINGQLHGVRGIAEQLSNRRIRLREFHYDGRGGIGVVVWLHRGGDLRGGYEISPDLRIGFPGYENETLEFPIPQEITDDMFHSVSIWCKEFNLDFGSARLSTINLEQ